MKENKYDDERFFGQYSRMSRSVQGLRGAGEWHELKKMLPDFNGKRVLDLGCGFGWHCRYAIERGATFALGIDLSGKMLDKAREINPSPSIEYKRIAIEDFDFAPNSFDIVISSLTFHYLESFDTVCTEVYKCLTEEGVFVFSVEHPVFTAYGNQDWIYDSEGKPAHWPVDHYFQEGVRHARFLGEDVTKYHNTYDLRERVDQGGFLYHPSGGASTGRIDAGYGSRDARRTSPSNDVAYRRSKELKKSVSLWLKRCLFRVLAKPRIKNKKDMKQQDAALVCFSGGQDSTTCLFWAKKHFSRVEAVCFTYGQKHSLEIEVARKIAADANVPFQLLDVSLISQLDPNCSLTNASIEMDQEKPEDSYPNTFVPGRNMVFLTFAAILARGKGIYHLVTGVSEADYSGYPDCRDTFVRSLNVTLNLAMDEQFVIHTPLMDRDKSEVWELSDELGVFDLVRTQTLTCYNGVMAEGCGHCPACKLRKDGLEKYLKRKEENQK